MLDIIDVNTMEHIGIDPDAKLIKYVYVSSLDVIPL